MKQVNKLIGLLLLALSIPVMAEQLIEADPISGLVYEVSNPKGCDRMFIFRVLNDASFKTINGEAATWTELVTGTQATGYNTFQNVQSGYCYEVKQGDKTETFVVIDYSNHRLKAQTPQVDITSHNTFISISNLAIPYYTDIEQGGQYMQSTLPTQIAVTYSNQQWVEKDWETVEVTDSVAWEKTTMAFDSILCDTKFSISESELSEFFYGEADSLETDQYEAVAVAHHQLYYITKRGTTSENEKEGPYGDGEVKSTQVHSAPVEVLFESHPSAKADVYTWTVKRGDEIRTQRNDKDIRYTFDEASESGPVIYNIYLEIRNSDNPESVATAQDTITINSSFIMVPNVFTPNGDGANDEFRVAYRSICEFHCWVYNRWQHLVYQWDDPSKGWDGTYAGKKEPDSAFIYIIEAKGCDGQKYKLKGTVNLLRGK